MDFCPNKRVKRLFCDHCGANVETLYRYGGKELCAYCFAEEIDVDTEEIIYEPENVKESFDFEIIDIGDDDYDL